MKSKILAVAAVAAAAALALSACSGDSAPSADKTASDENPFHYVFVGGITGGQASLASQEIASLQVAIDLVNADGGINGRKVEMETLDSKSDPTEAVSVLQKRLAQSPKPDLIRAGLSSTEALAMLPVTSRAGIPTHTSSATPLADDPEAYPYNLQVSAKNARQVELGRTYVESKKYKSLAVLAPEDASGDATVESVESVYEDSDIAVSVFRFNPADLDLSVAYQRAIADKPDVVYANCLGAPCVRVVAARESVAGGTDIPMFGDTSMAGSAGGPAASVPATAIENLHVLIFDGMLKKSAEDTPEEFTTWYDGMSEITEVTGISSPSIVYDGFRFWAKAFNNIKSTDAKKGIDEIRDIKWPAGFSVSYGNAVVNYDADSSFPKLPDNAFAVVQVSALEGGMYPPVDVFAPKVK
jgi:ABC-type branched-subunit amino acid transport system substrate-binding protein